MSLDRIKKALDSINEVKTNPELIIKDKKKSYGQEMIIDLGNVDISKYRSKHIKKYASTLCDKIGMKKGPLRLWGNDKDLGTMHNPKADGISCIQFLYSSSILIHAIDELGKIFINVFSCERFDEKIVREFTLEYFGGTIVREHNLIRK